MIRLTPMQPEHIIAFEPQEDEAGLSMEDRIQVAEAQAGYGPTWSVLAGDAVIAVGGICDSWPGRGIAWCSLSRHTGAHLLELTRKIRAMHESLGYRRIEMFVEAGNPRAARWGALLLFKNETPAPMQNFLPDGRSAYLFARIFP